MSKYIKSEKKYWEMEKGETVEFGNQFMRCFDKAGKLQFGNKFLDKKTGEWVYAVKFVIDRKELFDSDEGYDYLKGTLEEWKEVYEGDKNG